MYVCLHGRLHVLACVYECVYVCACVRMCVYMSACLCMSVSVRVLVSLRVCVCIILHKYGRLCARVHLCLCVFVCAFAAAINWHRIHVYASVLITGRVYTSAAMFSICEHPVGHLFLRWSNPCNL